MSESTECEVAGFDRGDEVDINYLVERIHAANARWWHNSEGVRIDRNKGELIALMHSELSEALEGERKNKMDDHLPHRKAAEVELADAVIRIFDYAGGFGYDLGGAIVEKLAYNAKRADHKHEHRAGEHGKKF